MKVSINNGELDGAIEKNVNLTIGRSYDVIGDYVDMTCSTFDIINDIGNKGVYHFARFVSLEDSRNEKLDKLGIS